MMGYIFRNVLMTWLGWCRPP